MAPTDPLDTIYTTDEAAERLRVSRRMMIKLGRKWGICSRVGTKYLFSEEDLLKIWTAIREAPTESTPAATIAAPTWYKEDLDWVFSRPQTAVDRRVLGILRWLNLQSEAKTYKQIDRAGPRTIETMLQQGLVVSCGVDDQGLTQVRIDDKGKEQIKIAERWARKRKAHGKDAVWW